MANNYGRSSHKSFVPDLSLKKCLRFAKISAPLWGKFRQNLRENFLRSNFCFFHVNVKLVVRMVRAAGLRDAGAKNFQEIFF